MRSKELLILAIMGWLVGLIMSASWLLLFIRVKAFGNVAMIETNEHTLSTELWLAVVIVLGSIIIMGVLIGMLSKKEVKP